MHIHAHLVQLSKQTHKPILHIVPLIRSSCNMLCLLCSTPRRFFGQQFSPRICGLNLWALGHFMSRFLCWGANRQIIYPSVATAFRSIAAELADGSPWGSALLPSSSPFPLLLEIPLHLVFPLPFPF